MKKKPRCLLLFSGGLDSILAAKILMEQGIEVLGIVFRSCFFDQNQAKKSAREIGLKLKLVDFSKEHLEIVKKPKYGYGKNMNPCIDCHLLMLKKAKEIMKRLKYDFVATGEVLDERPMSQNKTILKLLEKKSGLEGYLLRPLSAKLLNPTIPEKRGWVEREKLLDISGRQRKKQIELARKFKIKNYPTPAGGCLLTDPQFSKRLKDMLEKWPEANCDDIKLLKVGRHFWLVGKEFRKRAYKAHQKDWFLVVVGRDKKDNQNIKNLKKNSDLVVELKNIPGPTTLVRGKRKIPKSIVQRAKDLTKNYSSKAKNKKDVSFVFF